MTGPPDQDRYPPLRPDELTAEQAEAVREITEGPRGTFGGPFVPLLRSPGLLRALQAVGEHLRYHSVAEHRLVEFAVLLVSRRWTQRFEWSAHVPLALAAGVGREVVDAVARGERPPGMDAGLSAVWELYRDLDATATVGDAAFLAARDALGEAAVVEVVAAFGYYTALAMVMNMARTPAPPTPPQVELPDLPA